MSSIDKHDRQSAGTAKNGAIIRRQLRLSGDFNRTPAITSGEEMTMTDEKTTAEPSGASGG